MPHEKRSFTRKLLNLFVSGNDAPMGVTKDVSLGGLFVQTPQTPQTPDQPAHAIGDEPEVSFVWDSDVYTYQTKVVYENQEGIGLAFLTRDAQRDGVLSEMLRSSALGR